MLTHNFKFFFYIKNRIKYIFLSFKNILITTQFEYNEFKKINIFLKHKLISHQFAVVHDLKSSPPTYGDFLWQIVIARFLSHNHKISFIIIYGEYRNDWAIMSKLQIANYVDQLNKISTILLKSKNIEILKYTWEDFSLFYNKNKEKNIYLLYEEKILKRESTYNYGCNFINKFSNNSLNNHKNNFLLTKSDFSIPTIEIEALEPFITWHCRYNKDWSLDRNLTKSDFYTIYETLKFKFSNHKIVIVSDFEGTKYFKKWAIEYNFEIYYSQDYCKDFTETSMLVLNSKFYFQYLGGGIGMIPILSKMPYLIIGVTQNEKMLNYDKLVFWSNKNQSFLYSLPSINKVKRMILKFKHNLN